MNRCAICDEYMWSFMPHKCKPIFRCGLYDPRDEGEGKQVRAVDENHAASEYAIQCVADGDVDEICEVFVSDGAKVTRFCVSIRMEPTTTVQELESFPLEVDDE